MYFCGSLYNKTDAWVMLTIGVCLQNMARCRVILPVHIQPTIPIIISSPLSMFYDLIVYVNEGSLL